MLPKNKFFFANHLQKKSLKIFRPSRIHVHRTRLELAPNKTWICPSNIRVYQFRHRCIVVFVFDGAKVCMFFETTKFFCNFFSKNFLRQYNKFTIPDFATCLPEDVLKVM